MGVKYLINEDYFNEWSFEMAYLLGYLFADGSLEDASYLRGKYLRVTSIDKYIISRIKKSLDSKHPILVLDPVWPGGSPRYFLRIGSHKLYDSLFKIGLRPNKSLNMRFPHIPLKYLNNFIRGYFDGDGCIFLQTTKGKKRQTIIKKLSVIFTSGSKVFLHKLSVVLRKNTGLKYNKIYNSHRSYQLRYNTCDSIKLFKFFYRNTPKDFYFKRKFKIFLKYFKARSINIDNDIKKIIKELSYT